MQFLDDYQNAFQQIVEIEKYKNKFNFKVFNEPFVDEKEAAVELEDFELIYNERKNTNYSHFNRMLTKVKIHHDIRYEK